MKLVRTLAVLAVGSAAGAVVVMAAFSLGVLLLGAIARWTVFG